MKPATERRTVRLRPSVAERADARARDAGVTPAEWMADVIARAAK